MALGLCEKFLKKHPNSDLLLASKAFLLIQVGRDDVALQLIKSLRAKIPTYIEVLLQLEKSLIALNDYKAASEMFQQAFDSEPSEDLGILLFLSALRCEDFQRLSTVCERIWSFYS